MRLLRSWSPGYQKQAEQRAFGELFMPVSQRVQMNFIFTDNVRILCLSYNVKEVGKLVRFRQKEQKQASFLAFHKCCQGCLLRGPRYQFHTCLRPPQYIATGYQESLFVQYEKFIRLVPIRQKCIRIAYLYSKCTDCRINIYPAISTFAVQICYTNNFLLYSYQTNKLFVLQTFSEIGDYLVIVRGSQVVLLSSAITKV